MREIVLDTETTGLDPDTGDRIVELGAVELLNHMPTGRVFHRYVNPEREVPADAIAVHGLTTAFLADKPHFRAVAAEFAAFLGDARLVIHNAAFDMKFLNAELAWAGHVALPWSRAVDTLELARRLFPGAAEHARRPLPPLRGRQQRPHQARRAPRLRASRRGLPRAHRRPAARPDPDRGDLGHRQRRPLDPAPAPAPAPAPPYRGRSRRARRLRRRPGRAGALDPPRLSAGLRPAPPGSAHRR